MALTLIEIEALGALKQAAIKYTKQKKEIDWEQRRYEIAKEALPVMAVQKWSNGYLGSEEQCAKWAVSYADALIVELQKKG